MMRSTLIIFLTIFSQHSFAQSISPGVWKGKVQFEIDGLQLPPKEDEDCILEHEARNVRASIEKNLKKHGCVLTKWEARASQIHAALTCKNSDLDAKGELSGHFNAKSYELKGEASGHYKEMLPTNAKISLSGQWLKACESPGKAH